MRFQYSAHFVFKEMQESRRAYRHLHYDSKETETGMHEVCPMRDLRLLIIGIHIYACMEATVKQHASLLLTICQHTRFQCDSNVLRNI